MQMKPQVDANSHRNACSTLRAAMYNKGKIEYQKN